MDRLISFKDMILYYAKYHLAKRRGDIRSAALNKIFYQVHKTIALRSEPP